MAAGVISKPGSKLGPCKDNKCGHIDCAEMRTMAESKCVICRKKIGYNKHFYDDPDGYVHEDCVYTQINEEDLVCVGAG
jgi:hypothetical protein